MSKIGLPKPKKWAVFNLDTHFRLTEYATRGGARLACMYILDDQPDLKGKIGIRQKNFENSVS